MNMNILIIGGGGREHAITWKVAHSPLVNKIWVAPGNAGTALEPKTTNIAIQPTDTNALLQFAKEKHIDLTVVGPEAPLAAGIVDVFQSENLKIFGPTKKAAQLETSKAFAKDFMQLHNIPTARYQNFRDKKSALDYLTTQSYPLVIKASGLAAGKGVIIAENQEQATSAITAMLDENQFGEAGQEIVIEEFLTGKEISFITMVDGTNITPLATSQDYKRRDNDDKGPNTGGMGAFSPVVNMPPQLEETILQQIIRPTVDALNTQETPYVGFLYAGLMITPSGKPKVLEFNCRLGDPETQPLMMRLQSDLIVLCLNALEGKLNEMIIQWDPRFALSVVLTAGGYPAAYKKGEIITGLDYAENGETKIFHAGTKKQNNHIVTHGGRVLAVTALGKDIKHAQNKAYTLAHSISWTNCYYRTDIGS